MTGGATVQNIVRRRPSAIGINTMALFGMQAIEALALVVIPQTCIAIAAIRGKLKALWALGFRRCNSP